LLREEGAVDGGEEDEGEKGVEGRAFGQVVDGERGGQ